MSWWSGYRSRVVFRCGVVWVATIKTYRPHLAVIVTGWQVVHHSVATSTRPDPVRRIDMGGPPHQHCTRHGEVTSTVRTTGRCGLRPLPRSCPPYLGLERMQRIRRHREVFLTSATERVKSGWRGRGNPSRSRGTRQPRITIDEHTFEPQRAAGFGMARRLPKLFTVNSVRGPSRRGWPRCRRPEATTLFTMNRRDR